MLEQTVKRQKNIVIVLKRILQSSFFLYLVMAAVLWRMVDSNQAMLNRMNHIRSVIEGDLDEFSRGGESIRLDVFEWGVRYYGRLAKLAPNNHLVYGNLGFCYHYLKDDVHAVQSYKKAISLEPQFYAHYWDLGVISFLTGRFTEAVTFIDRSLDLMPRNVAYYVNLRKELISRGQDSMVDVPMLISRTVQDEENSYLILSKICFDLKNFDLMLKTAIQGLTRYPQNVHLNLYAGISSLTAGNYKEAAQYLTQAIDLDPNNIAAYYYRSLCMEKLGDGLRRDQDAFKVSFLKNAGKSMDDHWEMDLRLHFNDRLMMLLQRHAL